MGMEVICFCSLMALASSFVYPSADDDDLSPEQAGKLALYLLLSRYGFDTPDYPAQAIPDYEEPVILEDQQIFYDGEEKPLSFNTEEKLMPYNVEDFSFDNVNPVSVKHPFRNAIQKHHREQTTTVVPSKKAFAPKNLTTTTSAPDVLASMPPVIPNKGQKEFVMLRPPSDNHRKIEHIMEEMAKDLGMKGHRVEKKRWAM